MKKMAIFRKDSGFTLVEIMVVVGVIIVILALALPSMLRSRMNANEVAAISHCRLVANSCQSYYANVSPHTYPSGFEELATANPPYLDDTFNAVSPERQGYIFTYRRVNSDSFYVRANPRSYGRTGVRYFYVDETGIITSNDKVPAGPDDPPVSG